MCSSDSNIIDLHVYNEMTSAIVDALLHCVYHGQATIEPITDEGIERFDNVCLELGIKVKQSDNMEWTLELPLNTDALQKFLLSGELSDVMLVIEGEKLSVHRAILCCHSDVLLAMLSGAFSESHQKEV